LDADTGAEVFQGPLVIRADQGWPSGFVSYQRVAVADFTSFNVPGTYRIQVPTIGVSLPFRIDDGVMMTFSRAYALGLYHQRCGTSNAMPFTRHVHGACHTNRADVPVPQTSFAFTWSTIAERSSDYADNPRHTAPQLRDVSSQRYPFVTTGKVDVSGGHHDAGDYSKYTINSAGMIHYLIFAVDSFPGVAAMDNLGVPQSGDGISDLLQEAKWESDFLAKLQDADGGFYFLVYPRNREYETDVLPDQGDPQVVWPKTTAVTAAAVAALAQCGASPRFRQHYPTEAAAYLQKAQLGWRFLTNAIALYGKDGAYQKLTTYGNEFMHDDELAWASCEMYLATGDDAYHQKLLEWLPNPNDPFLRRWGYWRLFEAYGRAIRSYAFGARSGRVIASKLDAVYLGKCETELKAGAADHVTRSQRNAYGMSFPLESKAVGQAGWFFPNERAFDISVAYQLEARADYLDALLSNLNYEAGCNPLNVCFLAGVGWKRQREVVQQYAQNDRRVLPPSGQPVGSLHTSFPTNLTRYGTELAELCFPQDTATTAPYALYDRWADSFNVRTEFVLLDLTRSLGSLCFVSTLTSASTQAWTSSTAQISVPSEVSPLAPVTAILRASDLDLSRARVTWEVQGNEPMLGGTNQVFSVTNMGNLWIEAEACLPDGRRVFAVTNFFSTNRAPAITINNPRGGIAFLPSTNVMIALEATAVDSPPGPVTVTWSRVSGPGLVRFGSTNAPNSTAQFPANGGYLLRLVASDGLYASTGEVAVVVGPVAQFSSGLLAWWRFDESTGTTAADSSGNNRSATVNGALWSSPGRLAGALGFDGVDDNASFNSPALGQFTVSAWVRCEGDGDSFTPRVIEMPAFNIRLKRDSAGQSVAFEAERSSVAAEWRTPLGSFRDNTWQHVAVTFDANNTAALPGMYLNGINQSLTVLSTPSGGVIANTGTGYVGNRSTLDRSLDGQIDEVRIYNKIFGAVDASILPYLPATNAAPAIDAGPSQSIVLPDTAVLRTTVTDDGLPSPPASVVVAWSKVSGPGNVTFSPPNAVNTTASFSQAGTYTLAVAADDGQAKTIDDIVITVTTSSEVTVVASDNRASRSGGNAGAFTVSRSGNTSAPLTVNFGLAGTATPGVDYSTQLGSAPTAVTIASGSSATNVIIAPFVSAAVTPVETVVLTVNSGSGYSVGSANAATVFIDGTFGPITGVIVSGGQVGVTWASTAGKVYRVLYKDNLSEPVWREILGDITATASTTTYTEAVGFRTQRFYQIMEVR
jgi:hypothetical protein